MAHWIDEMGKIHDDMGGTALCLPSWPVGLVALTDAETAALREVPLAAVKVARLADINDERDRREEAGFPYLGKLLDSTPRSVQRITAAALAAQAALATAQPFQVDWTCADNRVLPLDAAGVIGMPVALAQHAAALHGHARALKMVVEAAETEARLNEIDIKAGWPGGEA